MFATLFVATAVLTVGSTTVPSARAAPLPAGFQEVVAFSGLTQPTGVRFASDGRVFVAEKSGLIKVFDGLSDTTPTVFADLSTNVYNFWDRGLLGLALDPSFPAQPYVYVLYTYDHELGSAAPAPRWGMPGVLSDPCPNPPGATGDGCVVSGRLSRLRAAGNVMTGSEQVLIEDWCQQYPSHSVGALGFGSDGALYVSGGDGASFNFTDYGQDGSPLNPCGDPPGGVGATLTPPTAQGGALRSQDLRTSGDPLTLDGAILRVNPATGAGMPDNPLALSSDLNARRIIASGLRNPFRLTIRPETNEVWAGDVGWSTWEEINRIANPTDATLENFGWPCYEGNGRQAGYDGANLNICESLYGQAGAHNQPFYTYSHSAKVVAGETCPTGSSSIAGLAFGRSSGGSYPAEYAGALFFADYSRDCIWVARRGLDGLPDLGSVATFVAPAANPVDLQISPSGELFYADFDGGTIRRIRYTAGNQPPTAVASATPTSGPAPLTVTFDGAASSDPDPGDTIAYAWDLDGDGAFDDSAAAQLTYTYVQAGAYTVRLRVTDNHGSSDTSGPLTISADNTTPSATLATPTPGTTWRVADVIGFSGSATDQQDGSLPPSSLSWSLVLHHCPSNCHAHVLQTFSGVASGSFTAPDHEYPSHLELRLTATDSGGLADTKSVFLYPQTVDLSFQTQPGGLQLTVNSSSGVTPFVRTVIAGSQNSISAPSPQTLGGTSYVFSSWSDGGAQARNVIADAPATYTAAYSAQSTATFSADADARVQESSPGSNYGTSYLRADGASDPDVDSYLRFRVAGFSRVTSARLRIYATSGTSNGPAVYAATDNAWSETAINWGNRPARGLIPTDNKGAVSANTWVELDVGPIVGADGTYTFVLATDTTDGVNLNSREASNVALRPQLVVTGDTAPAPPSANFTASPRNGTPPLAVQFTDMSTGSPTEWAWDFQDDGTVDSTVQHPTFTYAAVGTYTVKLTARNPQGSDDEVKTGYITVTAAGPPPAILTFPVEADARVQEASPSSNYGTSHIRTDGGSDPDVESYLRFTVAGVSTVTSAKLRIYATSSSSNGPAVYTATDSAWSETAITWGNRPARSLVGRDDKGAVSANTWVEFDVTPFVAGNGTHTFVLATDSTDGLNMSPREASNATLRPQLVITQ